MAIFACRASRDFAAKVIDGLNAIKSPGYLKQRQGYLMMQVLMCHIGIKETKLVFCLHFQQLPETLQKTLSLPIQQMMEMMLLLKVM